MENQNEKPSPEEQLLRLIEGEPGLPKGGREEKTTAVPVRPYERRGRSLGESLRKAYARLRKLDLKMINRVLSVFALILSIYLILTILPGSSAGGIKDYTNRLNQFLSGLESRPSVGARIEMPDIPDTISLGNVWKKRNIFTSGMPKTSSVINQPVPTTSSNTSDVPPSQPPVGVIQLQTLVDKVLNLKLVGVMTLENGEKKAIIEKGEDAYFIGINERLLKGTQNLSSYGYGEVKYDLKLKEIGEASVIIYNDDQTTRAEVTLSLHR